MKKRRLRMEVKSFLNILEPNVLVSRVRCRGKHRCSSGVTECGSPVARVDLRTQEKTLRCILVQAIGALRPVVVVLCIQEHPN